MASKYVFIASFVVVFVLLGIFLIYYLNNNKNSTSITPVPEPYVGKFYPPIDVDPSNVYRLVPDSGQNRFFNRTYIANQSYGNGQYDMATSSCWTSNTLRNVWNVFNMEGQGWLSSPLNYSQVNDSTLGLPISGTKTILLDESFIRGEWVQITFPQPMDFNGIQVAQTFAGYPIIVNLAIVANNDLSLVNAPIWKEESPLVQIPNTPIPTTMQQQPTPSIVSPSPVPVDFVYNKSKWTFLQEFKNIDTTPEKKLNLSFTNTTKYSTYRLIVTKTNGTNGANGAATINYVKFIKN